MHTKRHKFLRYLFDGKGAYLKDEVTVYDISGLFDREEYKDADALLVSAQRATVKHALIPTDQRYVSFMAFMQDFTRLIDLVQDVVAAHRLVSAERLTNFVPAVFHRFEADIRLIELCNAYALLPAFVRIAKSLQMLAQPESTATIVERQHLSTLVFNAAIKEEVSKLLGMYYTASPELGCEKLIMDKLKQLVLLLQWDGREEVIDLPHEELDPQPKELSIETRLSMIAYASWTHKANCRYIEPNSEATNRPTLLPSEQPAYADNTLAPCIEYDSSEEDPEDDYGGRLMEMQTAKQTSLWDATKEKGFCHINDWLKRTKTKLPPEAVYELSAREHYRVPRLRQQPTLPTITVAQTGTRIHRTSALTTANLEAGVRSFKTLSTQIQRI